VRACVGKVAYESERRSLVVAHRDSKRTGDVIRAYQCRECPAWHVGHVSRRGVPRKVAV
jgi:hypothetical protein